jgi:MYXO-CTERM domain-containing protein
MGQRQVSVADQTGSYGVEFTFGGQVHGFGFDVSGFQPNFGAGGFNISLFLDGQMVEDFFVFSDQIFGDVRFYGFTRDGRFDTARVFVPVLNFGNNEADYLAFDDVTWSVPSPAGLSALALVGLAAARRRRA